MPLTIGSLRVVSQNARVTRWRYLHPIHVPILSRAGCIFGNAALSVTMLERSEFVNLEDEIAALISSTPACSRNNQTSEFGGNEEDAAIIDMLMESLDSSDDGVAVDCEKEIEHFSKKWSEMAKGPSAFNLLLSPAENDFSGMVKSFSDKQSDEFVNDVFAVLKAQGKVMAVRNIELNSLFRDVAFGERFQMSGDKDLPANELIVIRNVKGFSPKRVAENFRKDVDFMFDRLSSIVDNRYILVVGNKDELEFFLDQDRRLRFSFGGHLITIPYKNALNEENDNDEIFEAFKKCISPDYAEKIDDSFKKEFNAFLTRNRRDLPFKGYELGDFLAKQCNAAGKLCLPEGRSFKLAQEKLDSLVGLASVKKTMRDIARYAVAYEQDVKLGYNPPAERFHMVFSGPPGTGKTTVGKLMAKILYEAGVIPTSNLVQVSASDLVTPAVGGTSRETQKKIDEASGGVLFIDEAYSLVGADGNLSHGVDAINTLVDAMSTGDLVVIFAGYREEVNHMISMNPGLQSRISFTLDFEAFSKEELIEILRKKIKNVGFEIEDSAIELAKELIDFFQPQRGFGNARFIDQLFHKAYIRRAMRLVEDPDSAVARNMIVQSDIPTVSQMFDYERSEADQTSEEELASLVGLSDIKDKMVEFKTFAAYREKARKAGLKTPKQTMHMVFSGNPGTGKTIVARIVSKILFETGVTPSPRFEEVSAKNLIGEYVGHTGPKTKEVLENAVGGVLFIDEAYSLMYNSDFGNDAVAEIVKFMEDYRDQMVIILAGYSDEMRQLLNVNPGLASRIGYQFNFEDYGTDELFEIFKRKVEALGYALDEEAACRARDVCRYFHSIENFGNGRFVDKVVQETLVRHAANVAGGADIDVIASEDVPSNKDVCKIVSLPVHEPTGDGNEDSRRIAIHEMGHAICGLSLLGNTGVKLVTIEEEATGALGYVEYEKDAFSSLPTKEYMQCRIAMCLGGMAAEELFMGDYSAGNSSDLKQATSLTAACVASYGMSDQAGLVSYILPRDKHGSVDVGALPEDVRAAMKLLLSEALEKAKDTLRQNVEMHKQLSEKLLEDKSISGTDMLEFWKTACMK